MKLILSLALTWMLSSSADALQCLHRDEENNTSNQTCASDGDMCASIPGVQYILGRLNITFMRQSCVPSSLCTKPEQKFSYRTGPIVTFASVHCCSTDYCNRPNVPGPEGRLQMNGRQCASCSSPGNDASCNVTVPCLGQQDRCVNGTVVEELQGPTFKLLGCASANMCQAFSEQTVRSALAPFLNFTGAPMCSSARTVRLSVGPLLLGLVARVVY